MKCIKIAIGNTTPTDEWTMEQFAGSVQAKTPFGKLIIALVEETVCSAEYTFSAYFLDEERYLIAHHPSFFPLLSNSLIFGQEQDNVSVRGVEDAVRSHLGELHDGFLARIAQLQKGANDLSEAAYQIVIDKARAAVVAAFPEAGGADYIPFQAERRDLYAFAQNGIKNVHSNPVYVARVVDNEITGGIVQTGCSVCGWSGMAKEERLRCFWSELARAFARGFEIPDESRCRGVVYAKEKAREIRASQPNVDGYEDVRVVFRHDKSKDVVVEFGSDNLPTKVYTAVPPAENRGLTDKHMTP